MNKKQSQVWIGEKDLNGDQDFIKEQQSEFVELPIVEGLGNEELVENLGGNRRDFLRFLGFGIGAATVAASCDTPIKRAIPYVVKPDEIVPGVANYYASTYVNGGDFCPVLVKTREGRPIKIEGNASSMMTKGGTSARAQASVLSLYDTNRLQGPKKKDGDAWIDVKWNDLDKELMSKFGAETRIRVLTNTVLSPSAKAAMNTFVAKYPEAKIYTYDPVSSAAILDACEQNFGHRVIPDYRFDKAEVIVSFNADFLGTWISPVEYAQQYVKNRKIDNVDHAKMSRHIQVENHMSLTGSNADNRILVKPSEQGAAIAYLANKIVGGVSVKKLNDQAKKALDKVASELKNAAGKSLVVSGSNNTGEQILINAINNALGNIGTTVGFNAVSYQRQGDENDFNDLVKEMKQGAVDVVIFNQCNPAYDTPSKALFEEGLAKVGTKVSMCYSVDETATLCDYLAPVHHYLESWGDVEAKRGHYGLIQPVISPLFDTRQAALSMLSWSGAAPQTEQPYLSFVKQQWKDSAFASQSTYATFNGFWDAALHDGVFHMDKGDLGVSFNGNVADAAANITPSFNGELEINFFETVNMGNGQFANNPWLQEMPDPVGRTSWGNYLAVPVAFDGVRKFVGMNDLKDGDLVELTIGGTTITVPVLQQFGQMPGTVSLALGYGRESVSPTSKGIGVNVNPFVHPNLRKFQYLNFEVSIGKKVGKVDDFACVQYHHTIGVEGQDKETGETINADEAALVFFNYGMVKQGYQGSLTERSIMFNSSLDELKESVEHLHEKRHEYQHLNEQTLYPYEEYKENRYDQGHHWGMHVDLNACIGCGACTVSCMAENNIPVVGKEEVSRHHEMTWLRIDRYYYGDHENPNVVYQPMMCQHCDNAPCENVCPVNATNHSAEGLNQMAYNRCVGTRYCANNCPYKVRRFNWLDYTTADLFPANQPTLNGEEIPFGADNLTRMVLNPDVTVRSRGVIEKCSFCVQRIQEGKLTAKKEGRRLRDHDVKTACQTACPTGAITFGDTNNPKGELAKKLKSPLNFVSLEEVNVKSSVTYTMKVNNRNESLDA